MQQTTAKTSDQDEPRCMWDQLLQVITSRRGPCKCSQSINHLELVKERDHFLKRLFEITILSLPANGPVNDHLVTSTFPGEGNEEDPGKKLPETPIPYECLWHRMWKKFWKFSAFTDSATLLSFHSASRSDSLLLPWYVQVKELNNFVDQKVCIKKSKRFIFQYFSSVWMVRYVTCYFKRKKYRQMKTALMLILSSDCNAVWYLSC